MTSSLDTRIVCASWRDVVSVLNSVVITLDVEDRKRLNRATSHLIHAFGLKGMYERVKNRTVREILESETDEPSVAPLVEGQRDGVKFAVYPAPDEARRDDRSQDEGTD